MFKLEIKTGGAAFRNPYTGEEDSIAEAQELERILYRVIKEISMDMNSGSVYDINGNKVGSWSR